MKPSVGRSKSGKGWLPWPLMKSPTRRSNMDAARSPISWSSLLQVSMETALLSMEKEASWLMPTSQDLEWEETHTLTQMNLGPLATRTSKVTNNHPRDCYVRKTRSGFSRIFVSLMLFTCVTFVLQVAAFLLEHVQVYAFIIVCFWFCFLCCSCFYLLSLGLIVHTRLFLPLWTASRVSLCPQWMAPCV